MNIQIQDLDKAPLDWAVASLLGVPVHVEVGSVCLPAPSGIMRRRFSPTSDWEALGPPLSQHQVFFRPVTVTTRTGIRDEMIEAYVQPVYPFQSYRSRTAPEVIGRGHNHQVAACRCIGALHKGASVDVTEQVLVHLGAYGRLLASGFCGATV